MSNLRLKILRFHAHGFRNPFLNIKYYGVLNKRFPGFHRITLFTAIISVLCRSSNLLSENSGLWSMKLKRSKQNLLKASVALTSEIWPMILLKMWCCNPNHFKASSWLSGSGKRYSAFHLVLPNYPPGPISLLMHPYTISSWSP